MALRGIQEYIARDVNNIARVEDEGNIVSIEGNILLYSPTKSHPILLFIQGFVCHLTILRSWVTAGCHFVIARKRKLEGRSNSNKGGRGIARFSELNSYIS